MDFRLSPHGEWEMTRRGIPLALVQAVMEHPEQRVADESRTGRWIHQSRFPFESLLVPQQTVPEVPRFCLNLTMPDGDTGHCPGGAFNRSLALPDSVNLA